MRSLVAASIASVVVAAAGCGSGSDAASVPPADLSDPDQVIATALETMYTWAPGEEASPNEAVTRASGFLTGDLAEQVGDAPEPGSGSRWEQWRAEGAMVEAEVYLVADETPPNSADRTHRVAVVIQSATTPDHRLISEMRHTVWVIADRTDDGWRVSSIDF